jgi:ABC-type transport system substrate-binding protein
MSEFDLAKAKALLDLYGYVDKDGDGWRDLPDGKPLVLIYATSPDTTFRQLAEQWQKNMDALGVRMIFKIAKWPEQLKAANAGKLQMWGVGWVGTTPDGDTFLALGSAKSKGNANKARFDLPAFKARLRAAKSHARRPRARCDHATRPSADGAYMPPTNSTSTASGPTWPNPGSRATAATSSCATSGNTSTSTSPRWHKPSSKPHHVQTSFPSRAAAPPQPVPASTAWLPRASRRPAAVANTAPKVLRYAFQMAETGFDPVQLSDIYSRIVTAHMFESALHL